MNVREFIIQVLLLSIRDRYSDAIEYLSSMYPDPILFPDMSVIKNAQLLSYSTPYLKLQSSILSNLNGPSDYPTRSDFPDSSNNIFKTDPDENKEKYIAALNLLDVAVERANLRDQYLKKFLVPINSDLGSISDMNPAYTHQSFYVKDLSVSSDLGVCYFDMTDADFSKVIRASHTGSSSYSRTLTYLGVSNFFSQATSPRNIGDPVIYSFNAFVKKLYIYPSPTSGHVSVFGKKKFNYFTSLDEEFPSGISDSFISYAQFFIAKIICSKYNSPWENQKEQILSVYKRTVSNENNIDCDENFSGIL